jgi:hypothetical protein
MRKLLMITISLSFLISVTEAQIPNPRRYTPNTTTVRIRHRSAAEYSYWKQKRYEISAGIGTTQSFSDIGGFSNNANLLGLKDFSLHQTRFNINTALKYRILDDLSARLNFSFGYLHSTDIRGSNESRGFESTTQFFEPSLLFEYYFIKHKREKSFLFIRGKRSVLRPLLPSLDFYLFTGAGGLYYKVKPNILLTPRVAETSGFTPVIPVGIGINMVYSRSFNIGLELGGRYAFSDNIDGYTSQYSKSNDVYYFLNLTFTYKIKTGRSGLPVFR